MNGTLYLLPAPLSEEDNWKPEKEYLERLKDVKYFIAERAKSARRDLRKFWPDIDLKSLHILEINKRSIDIPLSEYLEPLIAGQDVILMSEAGCPGIADPGSYVVAEAQRKGISVCPITGPSSIILGLMASGMNGQAFQFHGYLPVKKDLLSRKLRQLEQDANRKNVSQIFIETPYRNLQMIDMLCKVISNETTLGIAANLNSKNPIIRTMSILKWRKRNNSDLEKIPAIFILGQMTNKP